MTITVRKHVGDEVGRLNIHHNKFTAGIIIVGFGICLYMYVSGHRQIWLYEVVSVGMTEEDLMRAADRCPDYRVNYKASHILYYYDKRKRTGRALPFGTATVSTKQEIPDIYGAIQIVLDDDGHVKAVTWNGESYSIHTATGEVKGANVKLLDESAFD
jgi:hypothetical protein